MAEGEVMQQETDSVGARKRATHQVMEPLVSALHDLAHCDSGDLRAQSIPPLAYLGHPSSIRYLAEALNDAPTRDTAKDSLVVYGTLKSLAALKAAAEQVPDPAFQQATVASLGDHPAPEATEILVGFANSPLPSHRTGASEAFAKRGPSSSAEETVLQLLDDPVSEVAVAALLALRFVGSERSTVPLLRLLKATHNPFLRSTALLSLGRLAPQEANAAVKKFLKDPDDRIRASAVEALGFSIQENMQDVRFLLEALRDASNRVRGNAIVGLWDLDPDACRKPFHELMQSSIAAHRSTAAWVVSQVQHPELIQLFLPVINTEMDASVIEMTVRAIENADNPRIAPALGKLLVHPNLRVRKVSAGAFARLGRLSERPMLTTALAQEENPEVRAHMVEALGRLTDASQFADLLPFLKDPAPTIVAHALEALARIGDLAVAPVIEEHIKPGKPPLVRAYAASALVRLGKLEALGSLAKMAFSSQEDEIEACCKAAIQVGKDLREAALLSGKDPMLEASLEAKAPDVQPPLLSETELVDQSVDWEIPLAAALGSKTPQAALRALADSPQGTFLARFVSAQGNSGSLPEEDEKLFRSQHFLPGLFLGLERERAQGKDTRAVQERYLELADAQLSIYQEFLSRARERTRQGQSAEVFQMLEFFFRQVKLAPDLHRTFGVTYLGLKEYDLAFHHLLKASTAAPHDSELLLQLAGAAIRIHKTSVARAMLEKLIERAGPETALGKRALALKSLTEPKA